MKVICIKPAEPLVLDRVYTVVYDDGIGLFLSEVEPPYPHKCFYKWRFRPIEEKGDMFIEEFITIDEEEKQCLNYP